MEKGGKQRMWLKRTVNVYDMRKQLVQHEENTLNITGCNCFDDFCGNIFEVIKPEILFLIIAQ